MTEHGAAAAGAPALHHLALGTRDVSALARFYRELLGVPELRRHLDSAGELRSVWLDLAGTLLMIERAAPEAAAQAVHGVGLGVFLLAFRASQAERASFEQRALRLGGELESRAAQTSYLRDPDGNRIAFSAYELAP